MYLNKMVYEKCKKKDSFENVKSIEWNFWRWFKLFFNAEHNWKLQQGLTYNLMLIKIVKREFFLDEIRTNLKNSDKFSDYLRASDTF